MERNYGTNKILVNILNFSFALQHSLGSGDAQECQKMIEQTKAIDIHEK